MFDGVDAVVCKSKTTVKKRGWDEADWKAYERELEAFYQQNPSKRPVLTVHAYQPQWQLIIGY